MAKIIRITFRTMAEIIRTMAEIIRTITEIIRTIAEIIRTMAEINQWVTSTCALNNDKPPPGPCWIHLSAPRQTALIANMS